MDYVKLAEEIATRAHRGQTDKGGNPYILHPATVASFVDTPCEKTVAWLHDVVEDTPTTLADLTNYGFPQQIVSAIDAITRRDGEDRQTYLDRVKNNGIARTVKIADLKHNSDLSRISQNRPLTANDHARVEKYREEIKFLEE
ncbi:MAG: GTP pyrophosphokinase [Clostridia bacterium]|nr:GTP pyrophosphokinase [Clostridia bacterium]MBR0537990.1 GTP pyrophosphokinase [Clostridia bacterium]